MVLNKVQQYLIITEEDLQKERIYKDNKCIKGYHNLYIQIFL